MLFKVNDKEPIYVQIIRYVKRSLIVGTLKYGDIIPSRRELAEMLKVNPNTVQRAYKEMEALGIIETIKNSPSRICANEDVLKDIKSELIDNALESFIESMKSINVSKEEVIKIINYKY